jgi:hypothetical protein
VFKKLKRAYSSGYCSGLAPDSLLCAGMKSGTYHFGTKIIIILSIQIIVEKKEGLLKTTLL